jgi:hypothetical protein
MEPGHLGAKPAEVENPVDPDRTMILGRKIAERPRNERPRPIPPLPTRHAHTPKSRRADGIGDP